MLLNQNTALIGEIVILVPYRKEHVAAYHQWMSSSELRELTASEELTLEEEYEMAEKWRVDDDKLTFIVLANKLPVNRYSTASTDSRSQRAGQFQEDTRNSCPMIGDVNLFFKPTEEDLDAEEATKNLAADADTGPTEEVEVEIMIAEPEYRRKGYAREALRLIFSYVTKKTAEMTAEQTTIPAFTRFPVSPSRLVVRIGISNSPSILLFEKLGFRKTKVVEVFGEVEMRWKGDTSRYPFFKGGCEVQWP